MLETFYGQFQLLKAREEAFGDPSRIGRDIHALLAMETGGGAALQRVFELFAAGAAGAETGGGLWLGHERAEVGAKALSV